MKRMTSFSALAALLITFAACGGGEPMPALPDTIAGYTVGEQFMPDGPGWNRTEFKDQVAWTKQEGMNTLQVMCDANSNIQLIAQNLMVYNETTEEGSEADIKKYQDEIWEYKTTYGPIHIGQDRNGHEAFVGERIVLTVNMYKEGESGATRYIKTIKTRAIHDRSEEQR